MIAGIFHQGSGLGNQLHRYVATRVLAADKKLDFGMIYNPGDPSKPAGFKGERFMNLDWGKTPDPSTMKYWEEKKVIENGVDIRGYDPEINFVEDNTLIDGEFQDERYFKHRLDEVRDWLKVEPLYMRPDLCVIAFRGGEFSLYPDLFLTKEYWSNAMLAIKMFAANPQIRFEVHTDDVETAQKFFPEFKCIHYIGLNWRSIRFAKWLILSNSSFGILPSLLNQDARAIIAPRYWGRRNTKVWSLPQNYYSDKRFLYI